MQTNGKKSKKSFPHKKYGEPLAFRKAVKFRDKILERKKKAGGALPVGVRLCSSGNSYIASCYASGVNKWKAFSISKNGKEQALQMAIDYREKLIDEKLSIS